MHYIGRNNGASYDEYFMYQAIKEAQEAMHKNEVPIGAVICINDKIIARSHNLTEALKDVTAHAEMQAITSASSFINGKYLSECRIYTTLEPCVMCAGALFWAKIGKIVYGAKDPLNGFSRYLSLKYKHPKTIVVNEILAAQCSDLISAFFNKKRVKV